MDVRFHVPYVAGGRVLLKHEGAVGYVSGTAKLGGSKPVSVNR